MEPKFQTSFIPKKPISSPVSLGGDVIRTANLFSVVATVVFVVTILASVGLFLYKNILTNQVKDAENNIITTRDSFEPETISKLVDADSRIVSAKNLLEKHVVVSRALALLQDLTVKKMRFKELSYTNKGISPELSISGEIQTYNAMADQQDVFLKDGYIKNPTFSNFVLGDNGYISVKFTATIDPSLISYKKSLESSTTTN